MSMPCCPLGQCDFRPEKVRVYLHIIATARRIHADPVELARSILAPRGERHMGRSGAGSYGYQCELAIISVIQALASEAAPRSVEDVSRALCDHAMST